MPFSQQSYTGQGIVQQNVTPRVGEIIGTSLANFGQSIGAGIEKFAQRKSQAQTLRKKLAGFGDELGQAYGVDPKNWKSFLEDQGKSDLEGIAENMILKASMDLYKQKSEQAKLQAEEVRRKASNEEDDRSRIKAQEQLDRNYMASSIGGTAAEMAGSGQPPSVEAMKSAADIEAQQNLSSYRDAQVQDMMQQRAAKMQEQAAMGGLSEAQVKRSQELSDKLMSEPTVRKFFDAQSMLSSLENNVIQSTERGGPMDIALVFQFMKTLDPGSTVREGEYATAANSGSIPQNIINAYNKAVDGEFLSAKQRAEFLKAATGAAQGFVESANKIRDRYVKDGQRFKIPEEYAGGDRFELTRTIFSSTDDAEQAIDAGKVKVGDVVTVMTKDGLQQFTVED